MIENLSNKAILEYLDKVAITSCHKVIYKKEDLFPLILALLAERSKHSLHIDYLEKLVSIYL